MPSRKTDFNTEDIMGSLLGMQDKKEEEKKEEKPAETKPAKQEAKPENIDASKDDKNEQEGPALPPAPDAAYRNEKSYAVTDEYSESLSFSDKNDPSFFPSSDPGDRREYISIDPVRMRRREEKEMKVPVSFSLSRSMAEQLKRIAYVDRVSSSEIVSSLIQAFINSHQAELEEYRALIERKG